MSAKLIYFSSPRIQTYIVRYAQIFPVPDDGNLTAMKRRELERAVQVGIIVKGKGGPYPKPIDVYAPPGFDFDRDREDELRTQEYLAQQTAIRPRCRNQAKPRYSSYYRKL